MDQLKSFLDRKVKEFNQPLFIASDPVSVPHLFSKKQDIEIAGLFAALFAWGNRTAIINKSVRLMELMDMSPHDFIMGCGARDLRRLEGFCHRTFNTTDLLYFIEFLRHHYGRWPSLEDAFVKDIAGPGSRKKGNAEIIVRARREEACAGTLPKCNLTEADMAGSPPVFIENALNHFRDYFFSLEDAPSRTRKHIASPRKNSSCKRLNMYLRWMVRKDNSGVDFGIWKKIRPAQLICPIDLHVLRVAQRFKLIDRKKADWEAATALTHRLSAFDPDDPVKYDFALFGLGVVEKF